MRVLITTPPGLGHVNQLLPLGSALDRRGHDVTWATGPTGCEIVRAAGMAAVEAGPPEPPMSEFRERHPELAATPAHEMPDHVFPKMWGGIAAPWMLRDLLPIADTAEPDVIISDAVELAGPIVAARAGVPNVTKGFGPLLPRNRVAAGAEAVTPLWRSLDLEPRPFCGCYDHLYLDVYPPGLQPPLPTYVGRAIGLRPTDPEGHAPPDRTIAAFLGAADERPLVYLTLGTETAFSDPSVLSAVVAVLVTLDVRVLVTVGPRGDATALGEQPPQVAVARYVPQEMVLDRAALVVSHGGSGTTLAALARGLPHLVLPQGADQFLNADAVTRSGAGLALHPTEADPSAIRSAVARILSDPGPARAAARFGHAIATMPSPSDVAAVLEGLARDAVSPTAPS